MFLFIYFALVFYDIASFLIERGAKLEETDYQANTPLQIAAGGKL